MVGNTNKWEKWKREKGSKQVLGCKTDIELSQIVIAPQGRRRLLQASVCSVSYVCVRAHKLCMCFFVCSHYFPPATSSKDVTTRLHAVPSISPPSCPPPLPHLPLLSHTHSPVWRRPQQEKTRHCSAVKALRSPPLLVQCHTAWHPLPPSDHRCASRWNSDPATREDTGVCGCVGRAARGGWQMN